MYANIKHLFDKIVALALLIMLLPVLVLIAVSYYPKFDIFFIQDRVGEGENIFQIFKFRTLTRKKGNDKDREFFLGNVLRRSSLDELPQLFNVIKGEMSLIGPRPLLPEYLNYYSTFEKKRHSVRPGITGWAQVNGRNSISWKDKFKLDVYYVNNISIYLDLKITIVTLFHLITFQNKGNDFADKYNGTN